MSDTPIKINVTGCEALLSVIPVQLGHHPKDSVVVVFITAGAAHKVGPMVRVDLADAQGAAGIRAGRQIASLARTHNIASAVVVVYSDATGVDIDPLLDELTTAVELIELFAATNSPVAVSAQLAAEYAMFSGRAVLPDRAAVTVSIEYQQAPITDQAAAMLDRVSTIAGRDALLMEAVAETSAFLPGLLSAAQAIDDTDPLAADLLCVLAATVYRTGDGATANDALTRAARVAPAHRLAALLTAAVSLGVSPTMFGTVVCSGEVSPTE